MAFCNQCGNQLDGDAKFCTRCGKPVGATPVAPVTQATPVATAPVATAEKKSKLPLIILTLVGIIILAVAGMLLLGGGDEAEDVVEAQILTYQEQYDLGMKYLLEGNYEEAIIAFQAAIDLEPMMAEAYVGLADVYVAMGDYDQAVIALDMGFAVVEDEAGLAQLIEKLDGVMLSIDQEAAATDSTTVTTEPDPEPMPTEGQADWLPPVEAMDALVGTWGTVNYTSQGDYACLTLEKYDQGNYAMRFGYFWSEYFPDENINSESIVDKGGHLYEVTVESGGQTYSYTYDLTQLDQGILTLTAYTGYVSVWEYLSDDVGEAADMAMENLNNPGDTTAESPDFPGVTLNYGPDALAMENTTWYLAGDYFYTYNSVDTTYVFGTMLRDSNSLTFDENCDFEMWLGGLTGGGGLYGTMTLTDTTNVFDYSLDDSWGDSYAGTWYLGDIDGETVLCMRYSDLGTVYDEDYVLYWRMR